MDKQRRDAIAAIERTIEASKALRTSLRTGEVIGQKMIRELQGSTPIYETVTATGSDPADLRQNTNDLLDNFEHCRHEMRLAFIGPSLTDGVTIGQIGRDLGISRQLATRLAREARTAS
jgi:hypothetical protein